MRPDAKTPRLLDRITGCLAGLALGDALGTPALPTPEATRAAFGGPIRGFLVPPPDLAFWHAGLRAGQVTDDTQAALALVRAVIRHQAFSLDIAAQALVDWLDSIDAEHTAYIGPSTKAAYLALKRGTPPAESGLGGLTNGAAMRVAPLGFLSSDPRAVIRLAAWSAMPTHHSPIGLASAAAVAGAVAEAVRGGPLEHVLEAAAHAAAAGERLYAGPPLFAPTPDLARRILWAAELVAAGLPPAPDPAEWPHAIWVTLRTLYDLSGAGMAAHETVPTALAVVKLAGGDPWTVGLLAANLGGDADTIGAIAGAVCGAYRGLDAIPAEALATLEEVNGLNFRQLARDYLAAIEAWF